MKISIIGASGKVGAETTRLLSEQTSFFNPIEVVLYSPNNYSKICGQLNDLEESSLLRGKLFSSNVNFLPTRDISQIGNSNLIIVCAGIFATLEDKKKYSTQDSSGRFIQSIKNSSLINEICQSIKRFSPSSNVLIVTNQSDIMASLSRKILPPHLIWGLGCYLDTLRFKKIFADEARGNGDEFSVNDINATILGFHNSDMFIEDNSFHVYKQINNVDTLKEKSLRKTIMRGKEISDLQKDVHLPFINSGSSKLPAAAIFNIIEAFTQDGVELNIPLNRMFTSKEARNIGLNSKTSAQMPCIIKKGNIQAYETYLSPNNIIQLKQGISNLSKLINSVEISNKLLQLPERKNQNA